jgi:ubiquinone/menaquinone biosynthesis C-methylase UbiE
MKPVLLNEYLCCPVDRGYPLRLEEAHMQDDEIWSGYLICPSCGHRYSVVEGIPQMFPPDSAQAEEVAQAKSIEAQVRNAEVETYDSIWTEYENKIELRAVMNALRVRPDDTVIELGAGTGRLTTLLANTGATVIALDIATRSLEVCRSKCRRIPDSDVHYIAADACFLPLRDAVGHRAASCQLLEHIPTESERQRFAAETARVLKPGGLLALTAYNFSWTKRRRGERQGYHDPENRGFYYFRYSGQELRQLFESSGFKVGLVTGLLNLPGGRQAAVLDRLITRIPPVAVLAGDLLFMTACRDGAPGQAHPDSRLSGSSADLQ